MRQITHCCHKKEFLLKFDKGRQSWIDWLFEARKWHSVPAVWLVGIRESRQLTFHAQRGALFENLVVAGGVQRAGKAEEIG